MQPLEHTTPAAHPAVGPADTPWQRLDPRAIELDRIVGWIACASVVVVYSVVLAVMWVTVLFAGEAAAFGICVAMTAAWPVLAGSLAWLAHRFPELQYRYTTWRIDGVGLAIHTGVVWRKEISVPRTRVQHIDVSQGPLERRYGLATLSVYTAGTEHSQVNLDGLAHPTALAARDALLPASDVDAV